MDIYKRFFYAIALYPIYYYIEMIDFFGVMQ